MLDMSIFLFNSFMFEIPLKTTDVGGISCSYFLSESAGIASADGLHSVQ